MKKLNLLGTTTLASALLFTGVQSNTVNAASIDEEQASNSVKNLVENNANYQPKSETQYVVDKYGDNPIKNSYKIAFGEEPHQAPSFLYVKKDTGDIYDPKGNLVQKHSDNSANDNYQNQESDSHANHENAVTSKQELPKSGEESNSNMLTLFGASLLALGSLISFKTLPRNKQ